MGGGGFFHTSNLRRETANGVEEGKTIGKIWRQSNQIIRVARV